MKTFLRALVVLSIVFITGCNTMEGLGQDISNSGESLKNAARK